MKIIVEGRVNYLPVEQDNTSTKWNKPSTVAAALGDVISVVSFLKSLLDSEFEFLFLSFNPPVVKESPPLELIETSFPIISSEGKYPYKILFLM